jgi:hypothetical protein
MTHWADTERQINEIGQYLGGARALVAEANASPSDRDLVLRLGAKLDAIAGLLKKIPSDANAASLEEVLGQMHELRLMRHKLGRLL